jgi:predicted nicotinamide N-methyase
MEGPGLDPLEPELRRRYPLGDLVVPLPERTLTLLGAERAEDLAAAAEPGADLPLWAEVWAGGRGLAAYLLQGPRPRGRVLEVGAGVGLVGIALALRGATVVQTDREPDALRTAMVNAARCGVADRIRTVAADWRAWPLRERFSLVVGGDITYDRALHPPLLAVLERAVRSGGIALLADPYRPAGEAFTRALLASGWRVTEYPLAIPPGPLLRLLRAVAP